MSLVGGGRQNILVFGWGAAAEVVLRILAAQTNGRASKVCCISHVVQAKDCNLQSVCEPLGFGCYLLDSPDEVLNVARTFEPTLIISASYRKKIGKRILELCKDSINFHPSLLPRHRGSGLVFGPSLRAMLRLGLHATAWLRISIVAGSSTKST